MFFSHKFNYNFDNSLLNKVVERVNSKVIELGLQEPYCMVVLVADPNAFFFTHNKEIELYFLGFIAEHEIEPQPVLDKDLRNITSSATGQEKRILSSYSLFTKILQA